MVRTLLGGVVQTPCGHEGECTPPRHLPSCRTLQEAFHGLGKKPAPGEWDFMAECVDKLPAATLDSAFYKAVLCVHRPAPPTPR